MQEYKSTIILNSQELSEASTIFDLVYEQNNTTSIVKNNIKLFINETDSTEDLSPDSDESILIVPDVLPQDIVSNEHLSQDRNESITIDPNEDTLFAPNKYIRKEIEKIQKKEKNNNKLGLIINSINLFKDDILTHNII